ncbi:DUF948 domain-containing protein [Paenibacillus profundus]|uniref:DUF948 domain-containing protein n=1 Tax=Paenibacillus profundus TaxID=1173085 RepID=A0ABS8YJG9_9BACL|nr:MULTISPECIES: DUF948 domain-containing protein [Paenibacillus]MCE5171941.1 DUF948 domain-containing protein [Paenibacillus profundus]
MLVGISSLIAAIAFVVLVVFLIQTLQSAKLSLDRAAKTLEEVQHTVELLSGDLQAITKNANHVTTELSEQMKKIEPVVDSVQHAGEALNEITLAAKQISVGLVNGVRKAAVRFERKPSTAAAPAEKRESKPEPALQDRHGAMSASQAPVQAPTSSVPLSDAQPNHRVAPASLVPAETAETPAEVGQQAALQAQANQVQGADNNRQDWRAWVDLGTKAWQLWRQGN